MGRPDSGDLAVNGDEVRNVRFRIIVNGYDAPPVDDLLRRVALELDAGRPVGPLIASATFRQVGRTFPRKQPWAYDPEAVDWFLDQLRRQNDRSVLAEVGADPWRDLPLGNYFTRRGPADLAKDTARPSLPEHRKQARQDQEYLAQECQDAWRDFGQLPGTRLQWVRAGVWRRELRMAEQQTIASLRAALPATVSAGGRTFAWRRFKRSSRPGVASSQEPSRVVRVATRLATRELLDERGMPVLYTGGRNYDHSADARIRFADQRWLRFPVRGTDPWNAIMTAVDQAASRVARYRRHDRGVEIIVHPGQHLTDELVLALAISAPWLSSYFHVPQGGGG